MKFKIMSVFSICLLVCIVSFSTVSEASTLIKKTPKRMTNFFVKTLANDLVNLGKCYKVKVYSIEGEHPVLINSFSSPVPDRTEDSASPIQRWTNWNVLAYALDEIEIATRGLNKFSLNEDTCHEASVEERSEEDMQDDEPEPQPRSSVNYHLLSYGTVPMDEDSPFDDMSE